MSKAFLLGPDRRPFLHWCLRALEDSGIERVVLAVDHPPAWAALRRLLAEHRYRLAITTFHDEGVGVHGLPWQARERLDDVVLFEAGHGISHPDHYRALIAAARREPGVAVFSAFRPRLDNPRCEVAVDGTGRALDGGGRTRGLAHPMVVDRGYVDLLPHHGFNYAALARTYLAAGALRTVDAGQPVEFDIEGEYRHAMNTLRSNIADCTRRTPWRGAPRPEAAEVTQEGAIPVVV